MRKLPILVSSPHAGLYVPPLVRDLCILTPEEIAADGDEGATAIYGPLKDHVEVFATTHVARAIVDLNRQINDRSEDGMIKTHTCWGVPVYREAPSEEVIAELVDNEYKPYHERLSDAATWGIKLAVDCHTMAAVAPPIAPDPGQTRPVVCLGDNYGQTLSPGWMARLAECFESAFEAAIAVNQPFAGGCITRTHGREMPWVQLELSRDPALSFAEKHARTLTALQHFARSTLSWS
jgi:N-formylglutamate deformylase